MPEHTRLYEVLGVKPIHSISKIKERFRELAMKYHPDKNPGDQAAIEAFKEIQLAFEVLTDPVRRKRYNATGDTGERIDQADTKALAILHQALHAIMRPIVESNGDPATIDIVKCMHIAFEAQKLEIESGIKKGTANKERLTYLAARFTVADGHDNVLRKMAEQPIQEITQALVGFKEQLADTERAMVILERFRYETKPRANYSGLMQVQWTGSVFT